jgi:hypothetical protein
MSDILQVTTWYRNETENGEESLALRKLRHVNFYGYVFNNKTLLEQPALFFIGEARQKFVAMWKTHPKTGSGNMTESLIATSLT